MRGKFDESDGSSPRIIEIPDDEIRGVTGCIKGYETFKPVSSLVISVRDKGSEAITGTTGTGHLRPRWSITPMRPVIGPVKMRIARMSLPTGMEGAISAIKILEIGQRILQWRPPMR